MGEPLIPPPTGRPPPLPAQRRAADPTASVWVTASAGTGKTRVLTDRVLRLLLAGSAPEQLLCLTFTKAAAAEMVGRVQRELGRFAVLDDDALIADLAALLDRAPTTVEVGRARRLLVEVLDLPAGLPIMTIHGFCQMLLKRFPLEAGVAPHFEVLDDRTAADLLREAREAVLGSPRGVLQGALDVLAVELGELPLGEGLAALRDDRLALSALLARHGDDVERVIERIGRRLGIDPGITVEDLRRQCCADPALDSTALRAAAPILATSLKSGPKNAETLIAWQEAAPDLRLRCLGDYERIFLTKDRTPLARVLSKADAERHPAAEDALRAEQTRLAGSAERERSAAIGVRTAALLRLGSAVLAVYERRKRQLAVLDYDDLIAFSQQLLDRPGMVSWVHYKLDQQIDHVLVDEGQDTSPAQWAIIAALTAEFFAGEGARPGLRTLFVVGDEKQSIMSVQGADVEGYRRVRDELAARAGVARRPWRDQPLDRSFRSARPILDLVDAVFEDPAAREGVSGGAWPRHECFQHTLPGQVEVWPLIEEPPGDGDAASDWPLPDRPEVSGRAEQRLAEVVAGRVFAWLRDGAPLAVTGRPVTAGDVMILLPRRGTLQDRLIRRLKDLRVPVAGADRLALTDELAVMDLMALGEALLLPEDDLTLAAVLKSPLFGLDEEQLFQLAHGRDGSLYRRLARLRDADPAFAQAHERLTGLLGQVDLRPPFELYADLLGAGGGRKRLLARLGPAAAEPIEAFLAEALAHQQSHAPSLRAFLHWLRADDKDLVRDPDRPRDEVRVLTVHGAKGLEAPVVVLADATFIPKSKDRLLWTEGDGLPLWRVGKKCRDPVSHAAAELAQARQEAEQRRLLYVALTRARERLVVAGWQRRHQSKTTWYRLITDGMDRLDAPAVTLPGLAGTVRRHGDPPPDATPRQLALSLGGGPDEATPPPPWLDRPAPVEPARGRALSPSHAGHEPATPAPGLALGPGERFRRGRLIHQLLQILPELPPAARAGVLERHLAVPGLGLDAAERGRIGQALDAILDDPALAPLFAPGSRAEVPLAGMVGTQLVVGQIDRLAVTPDQVLVIDYKTDRAPPATPDAVPRAYWRQMAAYRALLRRIYPARPVRCALLWTEGPRLMPLDEEGLAAHAPEALAP